MKKNKIWKRVGAVILSTALLFGTLPTGVMAEETVGQDTNEEELQSKEVVSEDEPAEEILPEEVSSEEDAAEMDYDTAEAGSEVSESTGETDLQYHFTEGDVASILTWKEQYLKVWKKKICRHFSRKAAVWKHWQRHQRKHWQN